MHTTYLVIFVIPPPPNTTQIYPYILTPSQLYVFFCCCCCLITYQVQFVLPISSRMGGQPLEHKLSYSSYTLKDNQPSLPQKPSTIHNFPTKGRSSRPLPSPYWNVDCFGLVQAATPAMNSWAQPSCHVPKTMYSSSSPWPSAFRNCPLSCIGSWALGRKDNDTNVC